MLGQPSDLSESRAGIASPLVMAWLLSTELLFAVDGSQTWFGMSWSSIS